MADVSETLLERLMEARRKYQLPSQVRPLAHGFLQQVLGLLFPHFATNVNCTEDAIREDLIELQASLARLERSIGSIVEVMPVALVDTFIGRLSDVHDLLGDDARAIFSGDPAARSVDEVLLCYPGVLAMIHHRMAHRLFELQLPLLARIVAELAHAQTGIDIHPGATIGAGFFIDHGTGVVIGETTLIGQRVRLYQAVTLGAKRFPTDPEGNLQKGLPRHPIVEDDVVIYAGATILGRVTLGKGATIGGNVWITDDVPAGASVTQASLNARPGA